MLEKLFLSPHEEWGPPLQQPCTSVLDLDVEGTIQRAYSQSFVLCIQSTLLHLLQRTHTPAHHGLHLGSAQSQGCCSSTAPDIYDIFAFSSQLFFIICSTCYCLYLITMEPRFSIPDSTPRSSKTPLVVSGLQIYIYGLEDLKIKEGVEVAVLWLAHNRTRK
jgi:hypothetical protein